MKPTRSLHIAWLMLASLLNFASLSAQNYTDFVDPRIGTGDHGHVFAGANVPFGMVNAGPTQIKSGWDWCSGYHESCDTIVGFAQTHLSGTGCSDLGDIALMPTQGNVELTREGIASKYSHARETLRPGYYQVMLERFGINTEITATRRTALYRFTYPKQGDERLIVDLQNGVGDRMMSGNLTRLNDTTFVGYRISHGWADVQHAYFAFIVNRPALKNVRKKGQIHELKFAPKGNEPLMLRIALSPTSELNALMNLKAEGTAMWNFEQECKQADAAWNEELGRIDAKFAKEKDKRIFYTAMYHFMVAPQTWDDVNGDWRGADNLTYRADATYRNSIPSVARRKAGGNSYLTTLSLWDTYRAAAPLSTLVLSDMMPSIASTYLRIYREQGKLPVWHLMSQETNCMVGCPAVPILADLYLKGYIPEEDKMLALQAMVSSLLMDERGLEEVRQYGYLPYDKTNEHALSKTLEYELADWSAAQALRQASKEGKGRNTLGRALEHLGVLEDLPVGKGETWKVRGRGNVMISEMSVDELAEYFERRSKNYKRLWDPRVRCLRALDSQGNFRGIEGFNPAYQTTDYTEGNPWQYIWLVPQDMEGLVQTLGGKKAFFGRLDSLFTAPSDLNAEANPDITGLIGQYAHGNEPSHHIAYIYSLLGQPKKTAKLVRKIMRELYTDQPAGLCGNEDVGQMSAWYILSALGFYQLEPCGGRYVMGSPLVEEATLRVGSGKKFHIKVHGNSDKRIYVKKVIVNGKRIEDGILKHEDIVKGGEMEMWMGGR